MADRRVRELERRAAAGDPEARRQLKQWRRRVGGGPDSLETVLRPGLLRQWPALASGLRKLTGQPPAALTLEDLLELTPQQLEAQKGCGPVTVTRVAEGLAAQDLELPEPWVARYLDTRSYSGGRRARTITCRQVPPLTDTWAFVMDVLATWRLDGRTTLAQFRRTYGGASWHSGSTRTYFGSLRSHIYVETVQTGCDYCEGGLNTSQVCVLGLQDDLNVGVYRELGGYHFLDPQEDLLRLTVACDSEELIEQVLERWQAL